MKTHGMPWEMMSKMWICNLQGLFQPLKETLAPGQFHSRSVTTHKPPAGMLRQRLGMSSSHTKPPPNSCLSLTYLYSSDGLALQMGLVEHVERLASECQ